MKIISVGKTGSTGNIVFPRECVSFLQFSFTLAVCGRGFQICRPDMISELHNLHYQNPKFCILVKISKVTETEGFKAASNSVG